MVTQKINNVVASHDGGFGRETRRKKKAPARLSSRERMGESKRKLPENGFYEAILRVEHSFYFDDSGLLLVLNTNLSWA